MTINTVFTNSRYADASRIASKVASRPTSSVAVRQQPRIINSTKDNMRDIERAAEARGRMNSMASSLQSAMASLESANKDIDRLTRELQAEREKNAMHKAGSMEDVTALKNEIVALKAELESTKAELQKEREKDINAQPQKSRKWKSKKNQSAPTIDTAQPQSDLSFDPAPTA